MVFTQCRLPVSLPNEATMNRLTATVNAALTASQSAIEPAILLAFIAVESGGRGFDVATGKLIIQFEPKWFKKKAPFAPSGLWSINKVDVQAKEWRAFNNAFALDADAAMQATSIGLPQIMGLHWQRLGYASVGAMWDDFKRSELQQIKALIEFIKTDIALHTALINKDWHRVATIYNGSNYLGIAAQYGRTPYNIAMQDAYNKLIA